MIFTIHLTRLFIYKGDYYLVETLHILIDHILFFRRLNNANGEKLHLYIVVFKKKECAHLLAVARALCLRERSVLSLSRRFLG